MTQSRIDVAEVGPAFVLRLEGEIDWDQQQVLDAAVQQFILGGARDARVDLAAVTYLDSTGIATLVRLVDQAASRGGSVQLDGVPTQVRRVLRLAGLLDLFHLSAEVHGTGDPPRPPRSGHTRTAGEA